MKFMRTIIIGCFLLSLAFVSKAQEKFEYAQVSYAANLTLIKYVITTSVSGVFQVADNGTLADGYVTNNSLPINKVLNDLADKGWEVYSTQTTGNNNTTTFYYFLRRKKA